MITHSVPRRVYYTVFAILMASTYLTWQMAYIDLGVMNVVAALTIALFKAVLVTLFFMHLRGSSKLTWLVVIGGAFWLAILLVLTTSDYVTRAWGQAG